MSEMPWLHAAAAIARVRPTAGAVPSTEIRQSSATIRKPALGAALVTAAAGRASTHWRMCPAKPQPATRPFRHRVQEESAPA
eukprot:13123700-Heterocapsa_arctica.AAC.1